MSKKQIYMPGQVITTEEEFLAGENTFAEGGFVKAKGVGEADLNHETKEATVLGKSIKTIVPGDIVTGVVTLVKDSSVVISMTSAENGKKITTSSAQIPISSASTQYVTNLKKIFKVGDIVKARVSKMSSFGIDLETSETGLGVISAYCSNCRKKMEYSNEKLMCLSCGSVEERKWFEMVEVPRPREERSGGFGGGFRRDNFRGNSNFRPRNNFSRGNFNNRDNFRGPRNENRSSN